MKRFYITEGEKAIYNQIPIVIRRIIDMDNITVEEIHSNIIHTIKVSEISVCDRSSQTGRYNNEIVLLTQDKIKVAQERYSIIKPLLDSKTKYEEIKLLSSKYKVSFTTIYRWIRIFKETGLVSSLAGMTRSGGAGKSRLSDEQDEIINKVIENVYLNASRKSINRTIRSVKESCLEAKVNFPHPNTIRNRINNLSEELKLKKRYGSSEARYKFDAHKGNFPGALFPGSVVQIDHTPCDIILVDEQYRKPYQRPWLTVAIDVYSRMILGFYLAYESPGALGTGMCISNAILPKENLLSKLGIESSWPCWGVMNTIHVDNAKEFHGDMLKNACLDYGINLEFRPPATPHWGGHIERFMGTSAKQFHDLAGTTFSNIKEKKNYDSVGNASLTLSEFELWFTKYIVNIYHLKIHQGIGMSPLQKFNEGIFGTEDYAGRGLPPKIINERKLRLDFMPFFERSIQEYGIVIDHIFYYDGVMRKYIHKYKVDGITKQKFIFRRDPRDISHVYFYDPELNEYFRIPYRNAALPSISIWEFKDVVRKLRKEKVEINETIIFNTYRDLDEIEKTAILKTKAKRKEKNNKYKIEDFNDTDEIVEMEINENIEPFEEID